MSTPEDLGRAKTFFAYMEAIMASDLTPTQRLVLIVQAKHADAWDGELTNSYPSEDTLARETGLNRKTIYRTRKSLVELGWLDQTHSGRGGSSKLANSYDLYIPGELIARLEDAESKRHSVPLQSDIESRQSDIESQAKRHSVATSTSSSTPKAAPISTPSDIRRLNQPSEGTKEGRDGDSYWVGYSKKHPDGYFHRTEGPARPKGNVVLVTLTGSEVRDLFACYEYPQLRDIMLDYARDAGLRPPARDDKVAAGSGTRYPELGRSPREVVQPSRSGDDRVRHRAEEAERARYFSRTPKEKERARAEYRRQMDALHR